MSSGSSESSEPGRRPIFDFDQGLPDPDFFPTSSLAEHYAVVLGQDGNQACRYFADDHMADMQLGHIGLRDAVAEWLDEKEGCGLGGADHVTLVNGSTNGIALAINAFLGPGDALIVEEVSYPFAAVYARAAGATVVTVPVDPDGMDVDALEGVLAETERQGLRPAMIYTISTFHSPTGTVLPLHRRLALLETARRHGSLILDDNCYYHLWFESPPPPSLLALDEHDTVIQSGSFSKYLAPGLRMAWLAASPAQIEVLAEARQDFAVSQITARVVERFVRSGELDEHLAILRGVYEDKRDRAVAAIERHCGDLVELTVPRGGLYLWLKISDTVDLDAAMARSEELGVTFRPGVRFQHGRDGVSHLRLSVAQSPVIDIDPGIAHLGTALKESIR